MRLTTFSHHYKKLYGGSVGKVALDIGVPCPNRQHSGGCIFCAPQSFRPYYLKKNSTIAQQLRAGKEFLFARKYAFYFAYFQQETSTAGPLEKLLSAVEDVCIDPACVGVIISTRPDMVPERLLSRLQEIVRKTAEDGRHKEILFELGLQSAQEHSLTFLNRNHSVQDFLETAKRVRGQDGFQLGAHLIFGLPGETFDDMRNSIATACTAGATHLKIHHLQVIRGTRLEEIYRQSPFAMYGPDEYLELVSRLIQYIPREVIIHRLWSSSEKEILQAPFWGLSNLEMWGRFRVLCSSKDVTQGGALQGLGLLNRENQPS